jgi:hypothetical protein
MTGVEIFIISGLVLAFAAAWKYWPKADVNADGKVDSADVKAAVEKVETAAVVASAEVVEQVATKVATKAKTTKAKAQTKGKGKK